MNYENKILLLAALTFLFYACDFEIKCLDCTTETITFSTSEEKNKVAEALGILNELFDESFEKSNIKEIIPIQDKEGKPLLKILKFKKKGYALISDIKNIDNPPVLFFSKGKYDKDHPGFKAYVEKFKATAARDTINAILPSSESFRTKFRKLFNEQKSSI